MKKLPLPLVMVICALLSSTATAQFSMAIGPATGLNFNIHTGSDLEENGSGVGFVIAGQADMSFSKSIGLITSLYFYDNRSGSYSQGGSEQGVNYTADISASLAYFEIEPLFKLKLPTAPIYFVAGPSLGFNVEGSYETKVKLTTPGYTFPGGGTTQTNKGTLKDLNTRFELRFGGGYIYPLSKGLHLNPQFLFGYGLTNVQKDVSWKIISFQLLVGVQFDVL